MANKLRINEIEIDVSENINVVYKCQIGPCAPADASEIVFLYSSYGEDGVKILCKDMKGITVVHNSGANENTDIKCGVGDSCSVECGEKIGAEICLQGDVLQISSVSKSNYCVMKSILVDEEYVLKKGDYLLLSNGVKVSLNTSVSDWDEWDSGDW